MDLHLKKETSNPMPVLGREVESDLDFPAPGASLDNVAIFRLKKGFCVQADVRNGGNNSFVYACQTLDEAIEILKKIFASANGEPYYLCSVTLCGIR